MLLGRASWERCAGNSLLGIVCFGDDVVFVRGRTSTDRNLNGHPWHLNGLPCDSPAPTILQRLLVPTTDLLDFAACPKKHLRYCVVGCFTTAESVCGCHFLPHK